MLPLIPKTPVAPKLSAADCDYLTEIAFGPIRSLQPCDALFIFSGTQSGHWEQPLEAYQKGYTKKFIVTGGRSMTSLPHPTWHYGNLTESAVIERHLLAGGIPPASIISEHRSTNSLENVQMTLNLVNYGQINRLMFTCKSHAAGRQWRTLALNLPPTMTYIPYSFDAIYEGISISRNTWMNSEIGIKRVWGEYLRILQYGKQGDILPLDNSL